MFWSDLGPRVGYEAIGLIDAKLPTVGIWAASTAKDSPGGRDGRSLSDNVSEISQSSNDPVDTYGKGVVFYMKDSAVVGVVLWNVFDKIPIARKIIRSQKKYDDVKVRFALVIVHGVPYCIRLCKKG